MFSSIIKSTRFIIEIYSRSFSSKYYRSISPQLRFYLDTKSVYGPQRTIREKRSTKFSDFDLYNPNSNPNKTLFEKDTELLYGSSNGLYRACSIPKGISISERQRYLRHLFRIPRGQPASLYPQA